MDYWCRLGSLGNSSTASEALVTVKTVRTSFFIRFHFTSVHNHSYFLTFFLCFFDLFHSCCSHARVLGKSLVHEFNISYNYAQWYLFFLTSAQCVCGTKK